MASEVRQFCSDAASYRLLDDGTVEVNGSIDTFPATDANSKRVVDLWSKYGDAIKQTCAANNIPVPWFVGVMAQESGGNPNACSPCDISVCSFAPNCPGGCCAFGLMQFIDSTARKYGATGPQLLGNAPLAIEVAGRLLADLYKSTGGDYLRMAKAYNGGKPTCGQGGTFGIGGQGDYLMKVAKYANTFVALGLDPQSAQSVSPSSSAAKYVVVGAGALIGFLVVREFVLR